MHYEAAGKWADKFRILPSPVCMPSSPVPANQIESQRSRKRTCGLRLSFTDVGVMLLATGAGVAGYRATMGYSLFVPFVVYHFFLFCNVFRIRRATELVWAGVFVVHTASWFLLGPMHMPALFALQSIFTAILIVHEIRQPAYHGIAARRINPRIDEYLSGDV